MIVGCTVQPGAAGDTTTIHETIFETVSNLASLEEHAGTEEHKTREWVADKGYHSNETLLAIQALKARGYISEPNRGRRKWVGKEVEKEAVYRNRRRMRGQHGRALYKKRSELDLLPRTRPTDNERIHIMEALSWPANRSSPRSRSLTP